MLWYAIHTFSGQENNIKKRIEQMIEREGVREKFGRIIVPTREVVSTVRGRRHVSVQNAMPTYVFIEMVLDELTQHLVMNINGVTHFLGMTPTKRVAIPLQQSEVDRLLGVDPSGSAEGEIQNPYTIGENVRIKEGPFKECPHQGRSVQGLCGRRRRNHGRQDQDQGHGHCFRSFYACRTFLQPG